MPEETPTRDAQANTVLNVIGVLLALICVAASLREACLGHLPVSFAGLTEPGKLEALVRTVLTGAATIALYLIVRRPAQAEARVRNEPSRRRR